MSEEKAVACLESMPREVLDKIYAHLFDFDGARVTKVDDKWPWFRRERFTYVLFTALLRVNRSIGSGAKMVLYNQSLLVLFRLMDTRGDIETAFRNRSQYLPVIFVPHGCTPPPSSVIVDHRRYKGKKANRPRSLAIVIRAFDFPKLCNNLNGNTTHFEVETESYTLKALPEAGWPREQLRTWIWEPLKDLRHKIFVHCGHSKMPSFFYKIKAGDGTGTFEPKSSLLVSRAESEHEDSKSDDSEAHNHDDSGYEGDKECSTCIGCGMDEVSEDSEGSSEEGSASGEDSDGGEDIDGKVEPDRNAKSHIEVQNHTSETKTLEMGALRADEEEAYLGDDEGGDGHRRGALKLLIDEMKR